MGGSQARDDLCRLLEAFIAQADLAEDGVELAIVRFQVDRPAEEVQRRV